MWTTAGFALLAAALSLMWGAPRLARLKWVSMTFGLAAGAAFWASSGQNAAKLSEHENARRSMCREMAAHMRDFRQQYLRTPDLRKTADNNAPEPDPPDRRRALASRYRTYHFSPLTSFCIPDWEQCIPSSPNIAADSFRDHLENAIRSMERGACDSNR